VLVLIYVRSFCVYSFIRVVELVANGVVSWMSDSADGTYNECI
jgi:hypothetical protein